MCGQEKSGPGSSPNRRSGIPVRVAYFRRCSPSIGRLSSCLVRIIGNPAYAVKGQFVPIPEIHLNCGQGVCRAGAARYYFRAATLPSRGGFQTRPYRTQTTQSRNTALSRPSRLEHPERRFLTQQQLPAVGHGRLYRGLVLPPEEAG